MNTTGLEKSNLRIREYLNLWAKLISNLMEKFTHGPVTTKEMLMDAISAGSESKDRQGIWIRFATEQAGEQAFFISTEDSLKLSQLLDGRGAGNAAEGTGASSALEEFFIQLAAMPLEVEKQGPFPAFGFSDFGQPVWEIAASAAYCFSVESATSVIVKIHLSEELVSHLLATKETVRVAEKGHPTMGGSGSAPTVGPASDVCLDLLMDVELEVALRFGQREMLLRDVLSIAPGSVLELDQQIHDPVELLVGNKVIARGEVVTVDGNYGLRITSLASSEERMESLRK